MGTSNWQNISFCVDALMKIEPRRVLDIGVGFGRWGMLVREFCEVWYDRVRSQDWVIHVEGIEGFEANVADYHRHFYNRLHVGDARDVIPTLSGGWDAVIFGDVLEHFDREEGERLLRWAVDQSAYVLVNIPLGSEWPQEEKYENPFERHLSEWEATDFAAFPLRRQAMFRDFMDRLFGAFILSRDDPKRLAASLFSRSTAVASGAVGDGMPFALERLETDLLERVRAMHGELRSLRADIDRIKGSRSYRMTQRVLRSRYGPLLWRTVRRVVPERGGVLRAIVNRDAGALARPIRERLRRPTAPPPGQVHIEPVPSAHGASRGREIWLLEIESADGAGADWPKIQPPAGWEKRANAATRSGSCLVGTEGDRLEIPAAPDTYLVFMTHPWSGMADVAWGASRVRVDLYGAETGTLIVGLRASDPEIVQWQAPALSLNGGGAVATSTGAPARARRGGPRHRFAPEEREWLERVTADKPGAIAVMHAEWRGVRRATVELFPYHHFIDDRVTEESGMRQAQLLLETGCDRITLAGFPHSYIHVVRALHRLAPHVKLFSLWFGSFLQHAEDYAWYGFRTVETLCREGVIYKWGFAKKGMAEIMAKAGLRTGFVMSLVRQIPVAASTPMEGGPHLGIWAAQPTWRKYPYAMAAAIRLIPGAELHGSSMEPRVGQFARMLGIRSRLSPDAVPLDEMPRALGRMHLNLYVTLSECAPMVPLESLAVGAPCLFGPNSHYFEDHEYLHGRLVVPHPDRASTIAEYALRALRERSEIVEAYRGYAPEYNARALASLEEFLEVPCAAAAVEYA
jgi:hypothetical protein